MCMYIYIYLEPVCPLFWGFNPPKQGPFQSKQGSFGFQVYIVFCTHVFDMGGVDMVERFWYVKQGLLRMQMLKWRKVDYSYYNSTVEVPVLCPVLETSQKNVFENRRIHQWLPSLKLTALPLKMDGWNTFVFFWVSAYFQGASCTC